MNKHFEDLWVEAEQFAMEQQADPKGAITDLLMDINNYRIVDGFAENAPAGYVENGKRKVIGDMLLHVAHLSGVANVDVYAALQQAMESVSIRKHAANATHQMPPVVPMVKPTV
jgi:hypothetical protein